VHVPVIAALVELLRPRLDFPTADWLRAILEDATSPFDTRTFRMNFSRIGRRLGSHAVAPTPEEAVWLRDVVGLWPFVGWGADECGRAALLLRALDATDPATHVALVESLYLRGTIRERQSVVRVLAWLPDPARFAGIAGQACRSYVPSVFEAIALANPYPVRYLAPPLFDQMVLKAIATKASPERILGLADRVSTARPAPICRTVEELTGPLPSRRLPNAPSHV
jgi:hypothetical protein